MISQAGAAVGDALKEAQRARKKPRLLKSQAILADAHAIRPAMPRHVRKQKGGHKQAVRKTSENAKEAQAAAGSGMYDVWDEPVQHAGNGQLALAQPFNLDKGSSGK